MDDIMGHHRGPRHCPILSPKDEVNETQSALEALDRLKCYHSRKKLMATKFSLDS